MLTAKTLNSTDVEKSEKSIHDPTINILMPISIFKKPFIY